MPVTTKDGLLEAWVTQIEAMEQNLEALYGDPGITPTLPDVTTHDGMLEAIADGIEDAYVGIAKVYNAYHSDAVAYDLALPSNVMDWYGVKKVCGRTIVWNQLSGYTPGTTTVNAVDITVDADGILVMNGTASANTDKQLQPLFDFVVGHKYVMRGCPPNGSINTYYMAINEATDYGTGKLFTCTSGGKRWVHHALKSGQQADNLTFKTQFFDLTVMFGAGNEPTTMDEFNALFPANYYAPSANTLMNVGVKNIVVKDGATVKDTYTVPAEVQALTGYGMSCPNGTNYIDFDAKKFVQNVGSRAFASGDDTDSTVITDGANTNYKLGAAVETDISAYLTDVPAENVQSGWDIIFEYDDDYHIPVPVQVEYIGV